MRLVVFTSQRTWQATKETKVPLGLSRASDLEVHLLDAFFPLSLPHRPVLDRYHDVLGNFDQVEVISVRYQYLGIVNIHVFTVPQTFSRGYAML